MKLLLEKYDYNQLKRDTKADGSRTYLTPGGDRVPSVTTILSKTKDMTFLNEWKKRVGPAKAQEIVQRSVNHGTNMHKNLENYILEGTQPTGNPFTVAMTKKVINHGLVNLNEVWGVEVPLYADSLYAGTTDLVGVHNGADSIVDFKNARTKRKPEWVEDYSFQLAAYGLAHNEMFGTNIRKGVIMLCTHDAEYQEFVFEGVDFDKAVEGWTKRLTDYYEKYR
jgi:genome maintenance exonuclease 1